MAVKHHFTKSSYRAGNTRNILAAVLLSFLLFGCEEKVGKNTIYSRPVPAEPEVLDFEWTGFDGWGWSVYKLRKLGSPITGETIMVPSLPFSLIESEVKMYGVFKEYDEEEKAFIFQDTIVAAGGWGSSRSEIEVVFEDSTLNVDDLLNTEQYIIGEIYLRDFVLEHHIKGVEIIPRSHPAIKNARIFKDTVAIEKLESGSEVPIP